MPTDPRILQLAKRRQDIAHEAFGDIPAWADLADDVRELMLAEATSWLRAAVEAGLTPPAERPTDRHSAVWLDEYGDLWAEYQTSPPSHGDAILQLVWASEKCSSKQELEDRGIGFRLIGWSE